MKKIAFVDLLFHWPAGGGSWNDLFQIASGMQERGFEVKLFVPDFDLYFPRGVIKSELPFEVCRIPFNKLTFNFVNVPRKFKKAIDKFKPDYVFFGDGYFLKPYVSKALKDYPQIFRFYSYEIICSNNKLFFADSEICSNNIFDDSVKCQKCRFGNISLLKEFAKIIINWKINAYPFSRIMFHFTQEYLFSVAFLNYYRYVVSESIKGVSRIVVYNDYVKDVVTKLNKQVEIIPSGVNTEKFVPLEKKRDNSIKKILMAGRVAEYAKGLTILENAFKLLLSKRNDIMLMLTVDDYFKPYENRFQGEYFKLIKWVDQDNLPAIYNEADIVVVPSLWMEPFGIVAVEAMACGLPVIASAVGGLQKIVIDGETGFLVTPGDEKALMDKIELLLDSPDLRESMGKKGRKLAESLYSWDKIIDKYYVPLFS